MPKQVLLSLNRCDDCPSFVDDNVDTSHGCLYTPASCKVTKKFLTGKNRQRIPFWCPLAKTRSK